MHAVIGLLAVLAVVLVVVVAVLAVVLVRAVRQAPGALVPPDRSVAPTALDEDEGHVAGAVEAGGQRPGTTAGGYAGATPGAADSGGDGGAAATSVDPTDGGETARPVSVESASRIVEAARAQAAELVAAATDRAAAARAEVATANAEVTSARQAAAELTSRADQRREEAAAEVAHLRDGLAGQRRELERREQRFEDRDRRLSAELDRIQKVTASLEAREAEIADAERAVAAARDAERAELERVAALTSDQARAELLAAVEVDTRRAAAIMARDIEAAAKTGADRTARGIIATAIQRLASDQTSESVVTTVALAADEIKGRIIGREGRNIRAFEQITGVNVIIDDTPDAVVLSCFDPVRRETARVALEMLVADGRIHPHRIEETYAIAVREVEALCQRAAQDALLEIGISDLHPELVTVLGHLRHRTSYGQNVLRHLVECGHLAGLMAVELGIDPVLPRRCAFLHDIGKALTHEVEGSHALVGADLARRYGEHPDVVHAIEAHHNEVEPRTVEALLTQAADGISGGRPGARRESLETYVKRLQRLEEIGLAHPGVEKVYAMQAGREVRVMVLPDHVDDLAAQVMAREIVKQIEDELTYPGQIRVTVVRESRATETAR